MPSPGYTSNWTTTEEASESSHLASERAEEAVHVLETPVAFLTSGRAGLPLPQNGPLVQEHRQLSIDEIGLHLGHTQQVLNLRHLHRAMGRRLPYLQPRPQRALVRN